jgi:hypothetical protein
MRLGFTRIWARVHILVGLLVFALGLLAGVLTLVLDLRRMGIEPTGRALLAAGCLLVGVGVGGWAVVIGQLLEAFLDRGRLLRRIDRRLARWETERQEEAELRMGRRPGPPGRGALG